TATMPAPAFRARPMVSSPLASSSSSQPAKAPTRPFPQRATSFPSSQPLRPFPSIAQRLAVPAPGRKATKGVKLIEPPKNYSGGTFVLNLTQAELSRQD
ncbi:hypothetical protein DENSPDRAFT_742888, partial [Dentipellis sp. KUC8613]